MGRTARRGVSYISSTDEREEILATLNWMAIVSLKIRGLASRKYWVQQPECDPEVALFLTISRK
jgi:hypothetical protein